MDWKKKVSEYESALRVEQPCISAQFIRFGLFGGTGDGKSVTACLLAIGITPDGTIGYVDGENHRSGWAIDIASQMAAEKYGGTKQQWIERFKVIHIDPPFDPLRVVAAMDALLKAGCKTLNLDILSQAWDSEGGYIDQKESKIYEMTNGDEAKRGKYTAVAAGQIKPWTHNKLVDRINNVPANVVLLFQAKKKWNAKTQKPDEVASPIQESGMTRTALVVARVEAQLVNGEPQGGFIHIRDSIQWGAKFTHPSILALLPKDGEQMRFEHAEAIYKYCSGQPGNVAPATKSKKVAVDPEKAKRNKLVGQLWHISMPQHKGNKPALAQWLLDECLISDTESLEELTIQRLEEILPKAETKLRQQGLFADYKEVTP